MFNKILHRIEHFFGTNRGRIITWWDKNILMVGFKCECGEVHGAEPSITNNETDFNALKSDWETIGKDFPINKD